MDIDQRPSGRGDHRVVVNDDGHYSIWPLERSLPPGWSAEGTVGSREACLERIETVWTDTRVGRPAGVRS